LEKYVLVVFVYILTGGGRICLTKDIQDKSIFREEIWGF